MAFRNITKRFNEIRNQQKANRGLNASNFDGIVRDGSSGSRGDAMLEEVDFDLAFSKKKNKQYEALKQELPPLWVDSMSAAEEHISQIQIKIRELAALHTARLMVNFEADEAQQEHQIESCTNDITQIFRETEAILKRFGNEAKDPSLSISEKTVRQNLCRSMAKKLQGLTATFRSSQKEYMTRVKEQKQGSGSNAFDFLNTPSSGRSGLKDGSDGSVYSDGMISQNQLTDENEDLVNSRDEEITKIAKSIEDLAQIFKELAVLVIDQGTILDRIDYNMEQVMDHTRDGMTHLTKADARQKNNFPQRCIIILMCSIALMVLILIWKHSGKRN